MNKIFLILLSLTLLCPASYALTFDESYLLAVKNNYQIKKNQFDSLYYKDLAKTINRNLNLSYSLKNSYESGQPKLDYMISDKIDFFNLNKLKIDAYDYYYQANMVMTYQQKRTLVNDIADTYFSLLMSKEQYKISLENIKWTKQLLKNTTILQDAGKVALVDTILAKANLNDAIAKSKTYIEQVKNNQNKLKELTGSSSDPVTPELPKLLKENFYIIEYVNHDPNIKFYDLTNKGISLEAEYDEKTNIFSPSLYSDFQTNKDATSNISTVAIIFGIDVSGVYNPNFIYQRRAREKQILSNEEQAKQSIRDDKIFIDKLYHDALSFGQNVLLLEENSILRQDIIRRMEEGYKVKYISLVDLLKVRNDHINNLYALSDAKINLLKNSILLEKLVSDKLYAD